MLDHGLRPLIALIGAAFLLLTACAGGLNGRAICEAGGGRYAGSTCETQLRAGQLEFRQWCETHGGVYLTGQDDCAFGMGQ